MKPFLRHTLEILSVVALSVLWAVTASLGRKGRADTCQEVIATITDSLQRKFVSEGDVRKWTSEYVTFKGRGLDSLNLDGLEKYLKGKSAVREAEAWITDDGNIHVTVTQREPVVRFQDGGNGWYCDAGGFVFPLQSAFAEKVPIVDGDIPVKVERGFKGYPEEGGEWLRGMISMIDYMRKTDGWSSRIGQIHVERTGDLILIPARGKERFLMGQPTAVAEKFSRMKSYYRNIAPDHSYRTVDLRFNGQIVCSEK